MSEPESPRWVDDLSDELRRDVPVRPAWRARLLDEIARAPLPSSSDMVDVRFGDPATPVVSRRTRSVVLTPIGGVAAAVLFTALGAGLMYAALSRRSVSPDGVAGAERLTPNAPSPVAASGSLVRFELAAPQAARVALVGSFNDWDPRATPLVREAATGKWVVSLRLAPGRHVYAFVVDGDVTADPSAPRAADADFGSANSVVFVSTPST